MARVAQQAIDDFTAKHRARELGLRVSREAIRMSANTIRAAHRGDFEEARGLLAQAGASLRGAAEGLKGWPEIYHAGFLADARKEFTEANITLALISDSPIPLPEEIGVEMAPYLNGMGEVIGELRRFILDSLRRNETRRCEEYMQKMDDIYSLLVTVDFPEGVTGGLRRTTDAMRSIVERTRGDLTMALRQRQLEEKLASWERSVEGGGRPSSP
jgi:translin